MQFEYESGDPWWIRPEPWLILFALIIAGLIGGGIICA